MENKMSKKLVKNENGKWIVAQDENGKYVVESSFGAIISDMKDLENALIRYAQLNGKDLKKKIMKVFKDLKIMVDKIDD